MKSISEKKTHLFECHRSMRILTRMNCSLPSHRNNVGMIDTFFTCLYLLNDCIKMNGEEKIVMDDYFLRFLSFLRDIMKLNYVT
jgi:hypothetical protein